MSYHFVLRLAIIVDNILSVFKVMWGGGYGHSHVFLHHPHVQMIKFPFFNVKTLNLFYFAFKT